MIEGMSLPESLLPVVLPCSASHTFCSLYYTTSILYCSQQLHPLDLGLSAPKARRKANLFTQSFLGLGCFVIVTSNGLKQALRAMSPYCSSISGQEGGKQETAVLWFELNVQRMMKGSDLWRTNQRREGLGDSLVRKGLVL